MFSPGISRGKTYSNHEIVELATDLQRHSCREEAKKILGAANVVDPRYKGTRATFQLGYTGGTEFVEAYLEHPQLAGGWLPLTETFLPTKFLPDHRKVDDFEFRRWKADYCKAGFASMSYSVEPTGRLDANFRCEPDDTALVLAGITRGLRSPVFDFGMTSASCWITPKGNSFAGEKVEHQVRLSFPADEIGAATVANIFDRLRLLNPKSIANESTELTEEYNSMLWPLALSGSSQFLQLHLR
ncbi:MAG: hypothetical protein KDD70_01750 [Bdellovibrionales bacterium]|nr:hypothetical protein [Bdellovibrionales bacterium]